MKKVFYVIVCLCLFTACSKCDCGGDCNGACGDNCECGCSDTPNYKELIVGAWYNEDYQEYDKYMSSGNYYYEFPNTEGGFFSGYGEYSIKGNVLTSEVTLLGTPIVVRDVIEVLDEMKFVYQDEESGQIFNQVRVVEEYKLDVNERVLPELDVLADIKGYKSLHPETAVVNPKSGEIMGLFDGRAFIKVITDKGDVVVRVDVANNKGVAFPDFSDGLGLTKADVLALYGEQNAYEDLEVVTYAYDSDLVSLVMFLLDEESGVVSTIGMQLSENNSHENVLGYLKANFHENLIDEEVGDYYYSDQEKRVGISYLPSSSIIIITKY